MRQDMGNSLPTERAPVFAPQDRTTPSAACGREGRRIRRPAGRPWAVAMLALLLTLTLEAAPAQHARAVLARASQVVAEAGVPHHGHTMPLGDHDRTHDQHLSAPACLACVLMAAPGLLAGPSSPPARIAAAEAAFLAHAPAPARAGALWAPQRARAPPNPLPA